MPRPPDDSYYTISLSKTALLATPSILVFTATLVGIHFDRPIVRAPSKFYTTNFFPTPYRHFLSFHTDSEESSHSAYIKCTAPRGQNVDDHHWFKNRDPDATTFHYSGDSAPIVDRYIYPFVMEALKSDSSETCTIEGSIHLIGAGRESRKTLSMGIVQHPGFAIAGYGVGLTGLVIGSTVLSIALNTWSIIASAYVTTVAMFLVIGYAEFGGIVHYVVSVVAIAGGLITHAIIIRAIQRRTGFLLGLYVFAFIMSLLLIITFVITALVDVFEDENRFSILEHIAVGTQVLLFAFTAWELYWLRHFIVITVHIPPPTIKRNALWTAATLSSKTQVELLFRKHGIREIDYANDNDDSTRPLNLL